MKYPLVSAAVAVALSLSTPLLAQPAFSEARAGILDVRYLRLSDLPAVLASTGGNPIAWKTPAVLKGMSLTQGAQSVDPVIAWVPASGLESATARAEVLDIVSAGVAVLVTAVPGESRHEAAAFGVEGTETTVLYQPLADGTLHLHLFEDTADPGARAEIAHQVVKEARRLVTTNAAGAGSRSMLVASSGATPPSQTTGGEAPMKIWAASKTHANGARVAFTATVTRNTSRSYDSKLITVRSEAEVIPHQGGLEDHTKYNTTGLILPGMPSRGTPPRHSFVKYGAGLYVPGEYGLSTWIKWPENKAPAALLLSHHPTTDGSTDRTIVDKHVTTTSWGVGVSPEVSRGLADFKISESGKLPLSFSYGKSSMDEQSITMTLRDYSTAFAEFRGDNQLEAFWRFPLSDDISSRTKYFGWPAKTTLRTPMMKHAGLQTAATWRIDGAYEGTIMIISAASVTNKYFHVFHESAFGISDCSEGVITLETTPCQVQIAGSRGSSEKREFVATAQPVASIIMDLSSPYLTRTPTILLQSQGHADGCITQGRGASTDVTLAPCDRSEGNRAQQWFLDEAARYVNRGSSKCLDMNPADGRIRVATCSQALSQQWEWRADRIHSKFEGGRLRLHTDATGLSGAFRPGKDALLPVNATNALLPPWTTYPLKPRKGDHVPGFNFQAEPIPDAYLAFGDVDNGQRWATVPLIFGIK